MRVNPHAISAWWDANHPKNQFDVLNLHGIKSEFRRFDRYTRGFDKLRHDFRPSLDLRDRLQKHHDDLQEIIDEAKRKLQVIKEQVSMEIDSVLVDTVRSLGMPWYQICLECPGTGFMDADFEKVAKSEVPHDLSKIKQYLVGKFYGESCESWLDGVAPTLKNCDEFDVSNCGRLKRVLELVIAQAVGDYRRIVELLALVGTAMRLPLVGIAMGLPLPAAGTYEQSFWTLHSFITGKLSWILGDKLDNDPLGYHIQAAKLRRRFVNCDSHRRAHSISHRRLLKLLGQRAAAGIHTNTLLAVGQYLPAELAHEILLASLAAEEIPPEFATWIETREDVVDPDEAAVIAAIKAADAKAPEGRYVSKTKKLTLEDFWWEPV